MSRPWMPFYVADYLADTMHLTAEQHGAYLLLIMHYWRKGGLPANAMQMQAICKLDACAWDAAKPVLETFFDTSGETWKHKRIDEELSKSIEISGKRRAAAQKRHGSNADANAMQMHTQSQPQSHIETTNVVSTRKARRTKILADAEITEDHIAVAASLGLPRSNSISEFDQFRDHHLKNASLFADWMAAWRTWCRNSVKWSKQRDAGNKQSGNRYLQMAADIGEEDEQTSSSKGCRDNLVQLSYGGKF